jgi:hypothetical protein
METWGYNDLSALFIRIANKVASDNLSDAEIAVHQRVLVAQHQGADKIKL